MKIASLRNSKRWMITENSSSELTIQIQRLTSAKIPSNPLLMTCQVLVQSPSGVMQVRALLDSGSAASIVSERVAQALCLCRSSQTIRICGINSLPLENNQHSLTSFKIGSIHAPSRNLNMNAVVIPRVTCNLPTHPVFFQSWMGAHQGSTIGRLRIWQAREDQHLAQRGDFRWHSMPWPAKLGRDVEVHPQPLRPHLGGYWLATSTPKARTQSPHSTCLCSLETTNYASFGRHKKNQ